LHCNIGKSPRWKSRLGKIRSPRKSPSTLRDGFNRHYRLFRECSAQAKTRFEQSDWLGLQQAVRERIAFYDSRVSETAVLLHEQLRAEHIDDNTWQLAKLLYIGLLTNHKQPELAETFFNSVFCKIMHRTYFHNDLHFRAAGDLHGVHRIRSAGLPQLLPEPERPAADHPRHHRDFDWQRAFANMERDVEQVMRTVVRQMGGRLAADGGELPDPGAALGLLPQQGRLHRRQGHQRRLRVSLRGAGAARCAGHAVPRHVLLDAAQIRTCCSA
jgi:hypothetical protein